MNSNTDTCVDGMSIRSVFKKCPFISILLLGGPAIPHPLIVPWESESLGPYINVVLDAIGPEIDFTQGTSTKK